MGVLYWYFNCRPAETAPAPSAKEEIKETKETTETEQAGDEGIKSIPLEKPPFIK